MVRRSASRNLVYLANNVLSELEFELDRILDLSEPEAIGLTATDLTGSDHQLCQEIAAAALERGHDGLLVPAAALAGLNLVVPPRNLPDSSRLRVRESTALPLDLVAQQREEDAPDEGRA